MPFIHMLPDPGMNYTFNRPLLDGTSPARLKELSAIAPRIKDYDSWYTVWLEVAKKAEAEKRWLDAAWQAFGTDPAYAEEIARAARRVGRKVGAGDSEVFPATFR